MTSLLDQAMARPDAPTARDPGQMLRAIVGHGPIPLTPSSPAAIVAGQDYSDLDVTLDEQDRAFWAWMKPRGRPSFTLPLLRDLAHMQALIDALFRARPAGTPAPFDYFVLGSRGREVFNLGGDLTLFAQKIRDGDREGLRAYAQSCVNIGYANYTGWGHGVVTIALIQGDALGGGLEAPLSCDVMVAERQAKFGLPEILFNLFPGMGAYTYLARRMGMVKAEEMILSGKLYSAAEMKAMGVVDILAEPGEGEQVVRDFIARGRARQRAQSAIYKARRRVMPIDIAELREIADMWVDAALNLTEQDLRRMARIAAAQDRTLGLRGRAAE